MQPSKSTARDPDDWWWVFDPRQSLRARAAMIFGGLALAFSLLLGWTAETLFRRHLSRQLGPTFENFAFQIGDKLDRALDERLRGLQLGAALAPLKNPASSVAERRALLDVLLNAAPDCAWIGYVDAEGHVVAAAPQFFEGDSVAASAWFRGARRAPFVGGVRDLPDLARELPNPGEEKPRFLEVAVPVNDARGNSLGVLGAQLRWAWARDTQHSVVSDLARREHIVVTIYSPEGEVLLDSGAMGWTEPPPAPVVNRAIGARGFLSENVPGDGEFLTGYARTKGFGEFRGANWLVTVRQPAASALAPVDDVQRWIVRSGAVFTLVLAVLGWLVAGRIARRMRAVAAAAERIRGGDVLTLMPRPPGAGEVQAMCGALGEMVDNFRQQQERLEADNQRLAARSPAPDRTEPPGR